MNRKIIADLGGFIQMRYGVSLKDDATLVTHFTKVVEQIDKQVLANYFGGSEGGWHSHSNFATRKTGQYMVDKIKALGDNVSIIDIGCGFNELKEHFGDNLIGIDPYNDKADLKISIDDINTKKKFDVVLILGSLNFGDEQTVTQQFIKAFNLCKAGGKMFIRANPGITHENEKAKWIDFYEWSHDRIKELAVAFGLDINELGWDHDYDDENKWGNRIYAELTRHAFKK